jgi:hypothetical protein
MATKKENNMSNENEILETIKLVEKTLKPKQKFLNYEISSDVEVEISSTKYEMPTKPEGVEQSAFESKVLELAAALVQPVASQIEAFLTFATSANYQTAKAAAIASGPYVTSDVMSRIVDFMRQVPAFADLTASECRARWIAGYKAGKNGPKQLLDRALAVATVESDF